MKKYTLFTLSFLLFSITSFCQTERQLGAIFNERDYAATQELPTKFGPKGAELPLSKSLKEYMPPIVDQGACSTCMGWSVGHYIMTMMEAMNKKWTNDEIAANSNSSLFLFNQLKKSCLSGLPYGATMKFVVEKGNIKSKDFDQPDKCDCEKMPTQEQLEEAKDRRIQGFYKLFEAEEEDGEKIFNAKKALSEGLPIAAGMALRRNFQDVENGVWDPNVGNTNPWGGHAMTVVGYNDKKQAFELANTWGENWGNEGYVWVKYTDFIEFCVEAYVLVDKDDQEEEEIKKEVNEGKKKKDNVVIDEGKKKNEKDTVKPVVLKAKFGFRTPNFETEDLTFDYQNVSHEGDYYYSLEKKDWEIGDQFQLEVKGMQKGRFVYVFSFDNEGVNIHWPKNKAFSNEYSMGEAPIIPFKKVQIIIPGEERVLTRRTVGNDYVCIIYSDEELPDFRDMINDLVDSKGTFEEKFAQTFGKIAIPSDDINYNNNNMLFTTVSKSGKKVVPMILKIEGAK